MTDEVHDAQAGFAGLPIEAGPERNVRLTGQQINAGFMTRYILALMGLWVALFTPASVTLAIRVGQIDPTGKSTSLALVASAGAAATLLASPLFGALSDHSTLRWGQRRPFILGGLICGGLSVFALGFAPSILLVTLGWVAAQFSYNAAVAALFAILPERIPAKLRGRVSGYMGMAPQVGVVGGTYLIQLVGTKGYGMFLWPTVVGAVMMLPFLLTLREVGRKREEVGSLSLLHVISVFWINPLKNRDYALAWFGRFFVWFALFELTTYKTYFLIDRLGYTTSNVAPVLTLAMFILAAGICVSSIPGGWLSDKVGRRKPFVVLASGLFVVTMLVVAFATTLETFLIGIGISGLAMGLYLGVDYALVAQVLPDAKREAARGMAIFNLSSTIPQTLAPICAPLFLSIGASAAGGNYTSLYLCSAMFALVGGVITQFIRTK